MKIMGKKIVVVNAGPRKGWNTDTLLTEASKGAESTGAEIERFDLFHLLDVRKRSSKDTASAKMA